MSYGIMAYAVSLKKIENALGKSNAKRGLLGRLFGPSKDSLVEKIKQKSAYRFEQDEEDLDEEDEGQPLTLHQALVDLLDGNELDERFGDKYGYALELLCDHFGKCLENSAWTAMRIDLAEQVEEEMTQAGIDDNVISPTNHLRFRGPPIQIPRDDSPSIGFVRNHEMKAAAKVIDAADLSQADEDVEESVMQIRAWLRRCTELNCDLVCFYY